LGRKVKVEETRKGWFVGREYVGVWGSIIWGGHRGGGNILVAKVTLDLRIVKLRDRGRKETETGFRDIVGERLTFQGKE